MSLRDEFEKWANPQRFNLQRGESGEYLYMAAGDAWDAWQASHASLMARLPVAAIEVSLVYLRDKLAESDIAMTEGDPENRDLWESNSAALKNHISALTQLLEQKKP